jgi:hypothetical protein
MKFTSKLDYVSEFLQLIEIIYILMVVNSISCPSASRCLASGRALQWQAGQSGLSSFFLGKGVIEKSFLFVNYKLDRYPATSGLKKGVIIWKEGMTAKLLEFI